MLLSLGTVSWLLCAALGSPSGGRITGSVIDAASGAPVGGAGVTLTMVVDGPGGPFGPRSRRATTDANGGFAFDGVDPAHYVLRVEKNGFAPYPDVLGDGPSDRLTIDADHRDVQLRVALNKGAVIAGRIVNAAGEPEANLQVSALKRTDKAGPLGFAQVANTQTNDLGEFRMAGLPAGEYQILSAGHRQDPFERIQTGATTLAPTFFPGNVDQRAASTVTLVPGQAVTAIEFAIATVTAFHVSGVVVDQSGRPAPHAMVTLIPSIRTGAFFVPTMAIAADDGTFELGQVVPGAYHIQANASEGGSAGGLGAVSLAFSLDGTADEPDALIVGSADITGLKVVAGPR